MKNFYLTLREISFKLFDTTLIKLSLIVMMVLNMQDSHSQTSCANAIAITVNGSCLSGSVSDSSQDSPLMSASGCSTAGVFKRERWYSFTVTGGPKTITITADAADRNLFLMLISASSSCSGLTIVDCANNDDTNNSAQTETITSLLNNGLYYIKVVNAGTNNSNMTLSSLCVTAASACSTPTAQPTSLVLSNTSATSVSGSFTAASPTPNKYLVVRSTSATAPSPGPVNGTAYNVGNTINGATVISVSNSNSFTDNSLSGNTKYYYYIYSYNDTSCSGAAYNTTNPLTNNVVTCTAVPNSLTTSGVTGNGFTINWAYPTGGTANTTTYTLQITTDAAYTANITGSPFAVGTALSYSASGLNTNTTYYYRILANNGCSSAYVTGSVTTSCATPTAQPTTLVLSSVTSTSLSGSFTAASPAPSGYLIVRSNSATPPTLTNGTTYAVGLTTLTPGTTRVIQGSAVTSNAVTFTDSGLTANTQYYYHIFSYNNGCNGAPIYNTTAPLTNSAITCPAAPTAPVNSSVTGNGFTVSWTASAGGSASTVNYTLEVYTNSSYTTPIAGSPFAAGTALTYTVSGLNSLTTYYYRIVANNGCSSSYLTGNVTTLTAACTAPSAANNLTIGTVTSTSIPAIFIGTANGYLVIASTSATTPSQPVNGVTYSALTVNTLGSGLIFMQSGSSTTIAGTGLSGNTKYYYYIYSYNNTSCSGGPVYNTSGPLTGNAVTCPATPGSVATTNINQNDFTLNWTSSIGGNANAVSYTIQVTTDAAFTNNILDSPFTVPDPIATLTIDDLTGNTTYYYKITANNGCDSTSATGSVTTLSNPCTAPSNQAFNFTNGAITSSTYPASFLGSADGFLVVRSTSATPPSQPVNGTIYNAANIATLGTGLTFVQSGSTYNISSTGLTGNTTYYYYVYAYTNPTYCTGGPVYNASGALVGSGTTCPSSPTGVTASSITTTSFNLDWTAPVGGTSGTITYTVQITTNAGYTNNIPGSPFTIANPTTTLSISGLTAGTTYYYRILASNGCQSAYTTGSITTSITNDNCATAINLTTNTTATCMISTNGTTIGATQSSVGCSGTADDDVWYSFVAIATSHTVTVTPSTLTDVVFQLYKGTCSGLTSLGCIDNTSSTGTETNTFTGLTIGTTYYVRVYSYGNGTSYRGNFNICITTPVAPINDNCSGAIALTVNPTTTCVTSTVGTTIYGTLSQAGCSGTADDDIWYSFVAVSTSQKITVSPITMTNAVFQVFSGTCSGLTSMQCNNATSGSAIEVSTVAGLTIGATYYVRVYSAGSASGNGSFSICVTTPCSPGSGNGTTTTTCPNIVAGANGLNGADPDPVTCFATSTCTNLEAIYPDYNDTTSYTVSNIPYAPPYQFNCLSNPISVNVDDVWSNTISLPFNFCYYGNTYNKVLVGSNGVLTFDTTTYSPGGYSGWSFSNNLPSSSLFLNSIFGVYHDIDPSKGGEVGWELVTLSSGCRALVAAWSDIPMYSSVCNSSLYTGMIVLHENSNIIEVFIKEKNVCPTWNNGNAVVGIQNANGTQAVVAPNRNSNDTDWTVNEEAWRFTPSGASVATVKWYQGSGTSGPVVGTSSNVTVCPTATTKYTAEVTYTFCNGTTAIYTDETTVTVSTGKKWTGTVDTDWNNANNWSPVGVPTNTDCITIPNVPNKPIISGTSYNAYCYNLTVAAGSSLQTNSTSNIVVTDFVKVSSTGQFKLKDSSSLVQINNTATNTGSISMERTAYVKAYDYVYWCSPVKSFNSANISPASPSGYVFKWNPTIANGNGGQGNWVSGSEVMALAKGYIAISPGSYSYTNAAPLTATFNGIPYNGIRKVTISRGSYTGADFTGTNGATITRLDDNWNLIGNPYPSAVDAIDFLTLNTNINGNIRLWTHGSPISSSNTNPFYGSFAANYDVNDYISYNGTGSTPPGFNGKIAAGQAFFVIMNDGPASNSTVTFDNSMRNAAYDNSQFYRQNATANVAQPEKNRIWLSLVNANQMAATTLVGYVSDATYEYDRLYDASHKISNTLGIYSWIEDQTVIINGRPTPFDDNDYVKIGTSVPSTGTYSIGINQVDGLFSDANQDIFLEDTELNVVHNLREAPYTFTANAGNYNERFILKYKNSTLGTNQNTLATTYAYVSNHILNIKTDDTIKEIYLYDISGKLITKYKPGIQSTHFETEFPYQNGVYLATVVKTSGEKAAVKLLN